jgi:hypothetical protein
VELDKLGLRERTVYEGVSSLSGLRRSTPARARGLPVISAHALRHTAVGDQPLSGLTKQLRFVVLNGRSMVAVPSKMCHDLRRLANTASSNPPACETDAENIWRASPLLLRVWRNFNRLSAQGNKREFPGQKNRQSEPSDARDPQRCNAVMRIIPARRALPFWLRIHCSADAPGNKFSSLQCHLIRLLEPNALQLSYIPVKLPLNRFQSYSKHMD